MTHAFVLVLGLIPKPDVAPERLLSPTTQVYYRWDGVAAHREAYRKSARGQMLAGDTGKFIEDAYERLVRLGVEKLFGDKLLNDGADPDELAARHADYRQAVRLPKLLAETGIVVGVELRPPPLTLNTLGRLVGLPGPADKLRSVDLQVTAVVPNGANRPEIIGLCRFLKSVGEKHEEVRHLGRVAQTVDLVEFRVTYWAEGKHFVAVLGTTPAKTAIDRVANAGPGVTAHPLYKELDRKQPFEVVSRAYGDGAALWRVLKVLLAGYEQGQLLPALEFSGLSAIKAFRLWEGFDRDESRSVTEVDVSGPREGLTKLYKAGKFELKDLPPLPADVHRWSAGVFDITAGYEMLLGFFAFTELARGSQATRTAFLDKRRELADEIDGVLGMKVADLLGSLGDLGVTYQSPGDGLLAAGQVFAVRIKDEAAFKTQFDLFVRGLERLGRKEFKVVRRPYQGVPTVEFALPDGAVVRPTAAVCDGWMVWAFYPQPVHGFILRSRGKLPAWKPDDRTAKALAAIPPGPAAVQYGDPRPTVRLLLGGAQPFFGVLGANKEGRDLVDPGLLPHPEEACKPLFPNLLWTHNDGKTIRWETRESLALPFEAVGIDTVIAIAAGTRLLR